MRICYSYPCFIARRQRRQQGGEVARLKNVSVACYVCVKRARLIKSSLSLVVINGAAWGERFPFILQPGAGYRYGIGHVSRASAKGGGSMRNGAAFNDRRLMYVQDHHLASRLGGGRAIRIAHLHPIAVPVFPCRGKDGIGGGVECAGKVCKLSSGTRFLPFPPNSRPRRIGYLKSGRSV